MAFQYWTLIQDSDQWMDVPPYRQQKAAPNTKTYWFEQAACAESNPDDFEIKSGKGYTAERAVEINEKRFAEAKKLCDSCPVWHLCYLNATPEDFFYTMRAGLEPGQFTAMKSEGRIRYRGTQMAGENTRCKRDHINSFRIVGKKRKRRICVECNAMTPEEKTVWDVEHGRMNV